MFKLLKFSLIYWFSKSDELALTFSRNLQRTTSFYFIKLPFDLILQSSNTCSILLETRSPSSSNCHRDRGKSITVLRLKISINLALSCPSINVPLFMSNSEDRHTHVDDNEQERDASEATSQREKNGSSVQGGDGPNSKRFRIITEEKEYKWSLPQDMASYVNDNLEKYLPEKDVKEAILIQTPRPENLDPLKKLDD